MTTVADICADARRMAYGSMSEQINLVSSNVLAGATSFGVELDISGISTGTILSSGLNVWYVRSVNDSTNTISVIPNYDNSPSEALTTGDVIRIKPRVTDWYLFNLFNDEMRKLSSTTSGLYTIGSWTDPVEPSYQTYEVPVEAENMVNLLRLRYRLPGTPDVWTIIPPSYYNWQVTPTASRIQLLVAIPSGTSIEFTYKAPFTFATSLSDNVFTTCGLSDTMSDIPALGMVVTLLRTTDSRRNQLSTQGDPRRAAEVGSATNLSSAAAFERDYKARVQDEYARLIQRNPIYLGV